MNLDKKLRQWREAGLLDEVASARIAAFERAQRKPVAMYAWVGLGASTVGLGLVSLVAANWDRIPATAKLTIDLALGAALAVLVEWCVRRRWRLAREALVTMYFGYTLASLALVGQIYHLDTPTYQPLVAWCAVSLPLVLLGESRFLGVLYVSALVTAHASGFAELADYLERTASAATMINLGVCLVFVSPLLYVAAGQIPWLLARRPQYAWSLRRVGTTGVVAGGLAASLPWYESLASGDTLRWGLLVTLLFAVGFAALAARWLAAAAPPLRAALVRVVPAAWLILALSTAFARGAAAPVAAILQVAWLALCAHASYRAAWLRLFNVLTGLMAMRVLVVYFEVFGSMLDTGLGLLCGGALTLLAAWWWQRKARQLSERARAHASRGPDVT